MMAPEYALYRGDTFIDLGTRKYLASKLEVKEETITFYMSPTYAERGEYGNRYIVIRIEDEEDEHANIRR